MAERQTTPEPERTREREVIVTDRGRPGAGAVIATLLAIVALVLIGWLLFFRGGGGEGATPDDLDVPSEVDVNIDQPQGLSSVVGTL